MNIQETMKRFVLVLGILFLSPIIYAQPAKKLDAIRFRTPAVQLSFAKAQQLSWKTILDFEALKNPLEATQSGRVRRGKGLEQFVRDVLEGEWVKADYNSGQHGIDGLRVYRNEAGEITGVDVFEIKTGNAKLNIKNKQLSQKWILKSINEAIKEKIKQEKDLKKEIQKGRKNGKDVEALKREYSALNKIKVQLRNIKKLIKEGKYTSWEVRLTYDNGNLVITKRKVTWQKKGRKLTPVYGKQKTVINFSTLEKDIKNLSTKDAKTREKFFKNLADILRDMGFSEKQVAEYIARLKNGDFRAKEEIQSCIDGAKNVSIGFGVLFALASAYFIGRDIYKFCRGEISKTEMVFNTATNAVAFTASLGGIFAEHIPKKILDTIPQELQQGIAQNFGTVLAICFVVLDGARTAADMYHGNIKTAEGIVNIASVVVGTVAATAASSAVSAGVTAAIGAGTTVTVGTGGVAVPIAPIVAAVAAFVTFTGVFAVTSFGAMKAGTLIADKYESYKEPARFHDYCGAIRQHYALAS